MKWYLLILALTVYLQVIGQVNQLPVSAADQEILSVFQKSNNALNQLKKIRKEYKQSLNEYKKDSVTLWKQIKPVIKDSLHINLKDDIIKDHISFQHLKKKHRNELAILQAQREHLNLQKIKIDSLEKLATINPDSLLENISQEGIQYLKKNSEVQKEIFSDEQAQILKNNPAFELNEYFPGAESKTPEEMIERSVRELSFDFPDQDIKVAEVQRKVSKIKRKYNSVQDLEVLLADPPNPLYDRTFRQRIIWGCNLSAIQSKHFSLDIAPFVGYRLNHRFSTGISMMHRIDFISNKRYSINNVENNIIAGRLFFEYQTYKGWLGYLEFENAGKSYFFNESYSGHYENKLALSLGAGKFFKILKNWNVQSLILYDVMYQKNKSIAPTRFNIRFGFRWQYIK